MNESYTLGETWVHLLRLIADNGLDVDNEIREVVHVSVAFDEASEEDLILKQYASSYHIQEMKKVFFTSELNAFDHSYSSSILGPKGCSDFSDVIELLTENAFCKRAAIVLLPHGTGKVPCLNAVHFMIRNGKLQTSYFARGQDVYAKFYADALCVHHMSTQIGGALSIPIGVVSAFISSAHIYLSDIPAVLNILNTVKCQ